MRKVIELCGFCCQEVKIDAVKCKLQKCPNCGEPIRACCLCDMDTCDCGKCNDCYQEVLNPKQGVEYWVVYNPKDETYHYFKTEKEAYEYSSWHDILDVNVAQECFN